MESSESGERQRVPDPAGGAEFFLWHFFCPRVEIVWLALRTIGVEARRRSRSQVTDAFSVARRAVPLLSRWKSSVPQFRTPSRTPVTRPGQGQAINGLASFVRPPYVSRAACERTPNRNSQPLPPDPAQATTAGPLSGWASSSRDASRSRRPRQADLYVARTTTPRA